jgi:RNA polymerase sigma factor (sigma-70 family)
MSSFAKLIERVRAGDSAAATEMFRTYEPHVKSLVRSLMRIRSIHVSADPSDVCQSVMASFFIRAALGQYDISEPAQLMALLNKIARNKIVDLTRSPDRRLSFVPVVGAGVSGIEAADSAQGPASQVMWKDMLEKVRERLKDNEREVSELRMAGHSWDEVGLRLSIKADTARIRLDRALKRIAAELSLEGWFDD